MGLLVLYGCRLRHGCLHPPHHSSVRASHLCETTALRVEPLTPQFYFVSFANNAQWATTSAAAFFLVTFATALLPSLYCTSPHLVPLERCVACRHGGLSSESPPRCFTMCQSHNKTGCGGVIALADAQVVPHLTCSRFQTN